MILANSSVAKVLLTHDDTNSPSKSSPRSPSREQTHISRQVPALIRTHPSPTKEKLQLLKDFLEQSGFDQLLFLHASVINDDQAPQNGNTDTSIVPRKISDEQIGHFIRHYKSILRAVREQQQLIHKRHSNGPVDNGNIDQVQDIYANIPLITREITEFITCMIVKCMSEAKYISSSTLTRGLNEDKDRNNCGCSVESVAVLSSPGNSQSILLQHKGLGIKFYTHFTS